MWAVLCVGLAILLVQNDLVEGQSTTKALEFGSVGSGNGTSGGGASAAAGGTGTGSSGTGTGSNSTGGGGGGSGALRLANTSGPCIILLIMLIMCIMMQ